MGLQRRRRPTIPLNERPGYETAFDDETMTVLHIAGQPDQCIVSFTGVGHAMGGIDMQHPEFSRGGGGETRLFVIDKKRSWGNEIDWDTLEAQVDRLVPGAKITTLGNSMGGFLALLAAPKLGADHAIAFAPQWSIDPAIVPTEKRWASYRKQISEIRYPDLSEAIDGPAQVFVFFGADPIDALHVDFFARYRDRIGLFVLENCGHDVASHIKNHGQLYPVIQTCREGGDVSALLEGARMSLGDQGRHPPGG